MEMSQRGVGALEERAPTWQPAEVSQDVTVVEREEADVGEVIAEARAALEALQQPDGHWVFDCGHGTEIRLNRLLPQTEPRKDVGRHVLRVRN